MIDTFVSSTDYDEGKVLKKRKINPVCENVYLLPDGSIERDEDKIINIQRIFKHNWYKPGGYGYMRTLEKFQSCATQSY